MKKNLNFKKGDEVYFKIDSIYREVEGCGIIVGDITSDGFPIYVNIVIRGRSSLHFIPGVISLRRGLYIHPSYLKMIGRSSNRKGFNIISKRALEEKIKVRKTY